MKGQVIIIYTGITMFLSVLRVIVLPTSVKRELIVTNEFRPVNMQSELPCETVAQVLDRSKLPKGGATT